MELTESDFRRVEEKVVTDMVQEARDDASRASSSTSSSSFEVTQAPSVFSTPAAYHPILWLLLLIAPAATFAQFVYVVQDESSSEEEERAAAKHVLWSSVLGIMVCAIFLPKRLQVLADGSILVVTPLVVHAFKYVTGAYECPTQMADTYCPKIRLGTHFGNRVFVKRGRGCWDLVVAPRDVDGFISAVRKVTSSRRQRIGPANSV